MRARARWNAIWERAGESTGLLECDLGGLVGMRFGGRVGESTGLLECDLGARWNAIWRGSLECDLRGGGVRARAGWNAILGLAGETTESLECDAGGG